MPTTKVREGQCLLDIAMQECGDAIAAYPLALANRLSVTDDLEIGQTLQVTDIINEPVLEEFEPDYKKPASAFTDEEIESNEGIGFWQIEKDFVVS